MRHTKWSGSMGWLAVIAIFSVAGLSIGYAQNSAARTMFDEAVHWQEVKGDLPRAIALYRTIAEQHAADAVAPRALFELASCYEKLGRPEASAVYRQIVNQYASSEAAVAAKAKLGGMQTAAPLAPRRLWPTAVERVSPDGTYVTYTDWTTGDLMTREIRSGRTTKLTSNPPRKAGSGAPAYDFAEGSRPSPNSRSIAYAWYLSQSKRYELRVISRNGGPARTIYAAQDDAIVQPAGWFPDGTSLLVMVTTGTGQNSRTTLARVPSSGGVLAPIAGFDHRAAAGIGLSPDGLYVAFDLPDATKPERDVHVFSLKEGKSWPVVLHLANDRMLDWYPASDRLLFTSDRGGSQGIWRLDLAGGRPRGEPTLVMGNIGASPVGMTKSGDFLFVQSNRDSVIQIGSLDASARTGARLTPLQGRYVAGQVHGVWSPDGRRIAYVQATRFGASQTGARRGGGGAARQLAIQTIATGDVRLIDLGMANLNYPAWSPDGQAIVLQGQGLGPEGQVQQGLFKVEVSTGGVSSIVSRESASTPNLTLPVMSLDGSLFFRRYLGRTTGVATGEILRRNLTTGADQKIADNVGSYELSPDGRQLAIRPSGVPARQLIVLPLAGGQPRMLLDNQDWILQNAMAWSPDGRSIYVARLIDERRHIWRVPVDGSAPADTGLQVEGVVSRLSVHPDGRQIAVSTDMVSTETWILPSLTTRK